MSRAIAILLIASQAVLPLAGCGPSYSPDTYASNAVQQANKVDAGVIVGVRPVQISAAGTVGGVAGAAAGGVAGSQVGSGTTSTFAAIGGSLLGGIAGVTAEHVVGDTNGFEYIVRKPSGDLVSVAQKDEKPLRVGQKVLVIAGAQARIVPDYTVPFEDPPKAQAPNAPAPSAQVKAIPTGSPSPSDATPTPKAADASIPESPATPIAPVEIPSAFGASSMVPPASAGTPQIPLAIVPSPLPAPTDVTPKP